jgi:16S rRNA (cytosine967-C5)-methyltransferase
VARTSRTFQGKNRNPVGASPRLVAARIVRDVFENNTLFNEILTTDETFSRLSPADRRLAYHLAAGTIKYKRRLDYIARHFLKGKIDRLPTSILAVLRVGLFQLSVSEKIPPYAAVSETVKVARRFGHQGTTSVVNAVLRRFADDQHPDKVKFPSREKDFRRFLAEWYSYPDWLIDMFIDIGGEKHAEEYCRWGNREPNFYLRINPLKTDQSGLLAAAKKERVELEPAASVSGYYRWTGQAGPSFASAILRDGLASVQNPAAGLVVGLLDPQPGETVMDLFAAPGGKSGAIAERQKDSGRVLAVDVSVRRLSKIDENKGRLGLSSILPISGDAANLSAHQVDRVLADVPCSALGTLPKNPDARWQKTPGDIERLAGEQSVYLRSAAGQVRIGGILVYATCTITSRENHQVVEEFLHDNPAFVLEPASHHVPAEFVDRRGFLVTYPPRDDLDCIFAARLKRVR